MNGKAGHLRLVWSQPAAPQTEIEIAVRQVHFSYQVAVFRGRQMRVRPDAHFKTRDAAMHHARQLRLSNGWNIVDATVETVDL